MAKVRTFALLPICLSAAVATVGLLAVMHGASHPSAASRLVGRWRLVSAGTITDGSFRANSELGPNPLGYLTYEQTGRVCVTLADPVNTYCGTYEVREDRGQIIHRPQGVAWPHFLGMDGTRKFRFDADRLILGGAERPPSGSSGEYQVTWERAPELPLAD